MTGNGHRDTSIPACSSEQLLSNSLKHRARETHACSGHLRCLFLPSFFPQPTHDASEQDAPEAENTTILTPEPDTPLVTSTEAPAAGARDLDVTPSPLSDNAAAGEDTAGVAGRESPGMRGLVSIGLGVLVGMAALV